MARMKKRTFTEEYVQIPNETTRAVETKNNEHSISLQALGLLVNLWSYGENWELHKTELYKRYKKNKETSVSNAWKELIEAKYIVEFRFRNNGKWDYEYFFDIKPYTDEQIAQIIAESLEEYGEISTLDFQDLKNKTWNSRPENPELLNTNKRNTKKRNTKRNSSSSLDAQNLIDKELKEKYPDAPFDKIKAKMLSDQTVDISTDKQYKGLLEHRLKAWKPRKTFVMGARAKKKPIRTELIPEWFEESEKAHSEPQRNDEEIAAKKKAIEEKLKQFRK